METPILDKLDFKPSRRGGETAILGPLSIEIDRDDHYRENPWTDWDGEILVIYRMDTTVKQGHGIETFNPFPEDIEWWERHKAELNEKAELDPEEWSDPDLFDDWQRAVMDAFEDDSNFPDYCDRMEWICNLVNIPCRQFTWQGYCQGDYASGILIVTPECVEVRGNSPGFDWEKSLDCAIELFDTWAKGEIYWFNVEGQSGHESCTGFFGEDAVKEAVEELLVPFFRDEHNFINKRVSEINAEVRRLKIEIPTAGAELKALGQQRLHELDNEKRKLLKDRGILYAFPL